MRDNKLRKLLNENKIVMGTMLQDFKSLAVPIVLANAGFDFIFVCMEHSAYSLEDVSNLITTIRLLNLTPLVRVPEIKYHFISRCLDAGAEGIMVPRVETKEEVERIVQYAKYPLLGRRGCSVNRGHNDYISQNSVEFMKESNEQNMIILEIEAKRAIEDIDSLFSVEGVDAAIIGVNDLCATYGLPNDPTIPMISEAIQKTIDAARRFGIPSGIHSRNIGQLKQWIERGMQMIVYQTDLGLIKEAASKGIKELRDYASKCDNSKNNSQTET